MRLFSLIPSMRHANAAFRRAASQLASSAPVNLTTLLAPSKFQPKSQPSTAPYPTFEEIREIITIHARSVYSSKIEFDPSREHDPSVGSQKVIVQLKSQPYCWRTYRSPRNRCRLGVLIQEMDILATWVGYKHNQDPNVPMGTAAHHTMGVITARVDRMDIALEAQFRSDEDLILHGYVSWVGKSSMEVTIDITQNDADQVPKLQMTAKYVMVTMTPEFKAAPNVTLSLRDERDRQLFEMGARAKDLRTQRDKTAVGLVMPTLDELNILREQELKIMDPLTLTSHRSRLSEGHALMDDAKLANSVICMPLETNLHGTVFGGFLIRTSYETAWANASVFANGPVNCTAITNALYPRAIRLGSLLYINSQVCYTHERLLQTLVTCRVRNPKTGNLETTNVFHFTFEAEAPVRSLIPGNYADGLRYIHCRRELEYAVAKAALATEVQQ